ncbi:MAG: histone deacetylase family protein [Planctomycetes bacterium]|nr:histone deacetylase family protein [Planctomycetota bacterium]
MFRIRKVSDDTLPANRREIATVQQTLRERLPGVPSDEIDALPDKIRDPLAHRFRALLFVADDLRGRHKGFALLSHAPDVGFCLLDYVATASGLSGHGVGGALYDRIREAARELAPLGLFFECLPDDPDACSDARIVAENRKRLAFYELWGARPIVGTEYELPLTDGQLDMPHLVWDDLDRGTPLRRDDARRVVRALLERKYAELCPPDYIDRVVASFRDDPVRVRDRRYHKRPKAPPARRYVGERKVALVVNTEHDIHHVREKGYVEAPARVRSILAQLEPTGSYWRIEPRSYGDSHILAVHEKDLVRYLKAACAKVEPDKSIYPYVFPVRNHTRPPEDLAYAAGYWCIDTFTPLNRNAWLAARRAVDCTLTAAETVLDGQRAAYALVRPPGHHAERRVFGGFCYLNNTAIGAEFLAAHGRVAILDVDYHHGNGQQDIFYERDDVLTVSLHGHPRFAYPFFSGYAEERGAGPGFGFNHNMPMPEQVDGERYRRELQKALRAIAAFAPRFLVVALGLDTASKDPTGTWSLRTSDFAQNGALIGALGIPTLVVQEGGYRTASLGQNARAFFDGLLGGPGAETRS